MHKYIQVSFTDKKRIVCSLHVMSLISLSS